MLTINDTVDGLLGIKDVANFMDLHHRTVYTLVTEGRIPGIKIGGKWRFDLLTIKNWVSRQMINNCARTIKKELYRDQTA